MNALPGGSQRPRGPRQRWRPSWRQAVIWLSQQPTPWLWLLACIVIFSAAGVVLAAFPSPYWLWSLALGSVAIQAIALAGPQILRRFRWMEANAIALGATMGAAGLAVALSISLGFAGTDNLNQTTPRQFLLDTITFSLLAIVVTALCACVMAATGDRLISIYGRPQTSLILAATCVLGLGLGGSLALLLI